MSEAVQPRVVKKVLQEYGSSTGALKIRDMDDVAWVIKPLRKSSFARDQVLNYNEQVVGRIGRALLANTIPEVALVTISHAIIETQNLGDVMPGTCHGSKFMEGLGDGEAIRKPSVSAMASRVRIARLTALLRLCATEGRQFFYKGSDCSSDAFVYSMDHGSSFLDATDGIPDGEEGQWLNRHLSDSVSLPLFFEMVTTAGADLTHDELVCGALVLNEVTDESIAKAVHAPPESAFGVPIVRRRALAKWLQRRRDKLLGNV